MTPRELAGAIRRAAQCYLWVPITGDKGGNGVFIPVSKNTAHLVVDEAYEEGYKNVEAEWDGTDLNIGAQVVPAATEEQGDGEQEEEVEAP